MHVSVFENECHILLWGDFFFKHAYTFQQKKRKKIIEISIDALLFTW